MSEFDISSWDSYLKHFDMYLLSKDAEITAYARNQMTIELKRHGLETRPIHKHTCSDCPKECSPASRRCQPCHLQLMNERKTRNGRNTVRAA